MAVTFCLLDETNDMEAYASAENLRWAWQRWASASCVEWNGDHLWSASTDGLAFDSRLLSVVCGYCGADLDAVFGPSDSIDLVYGEVSGIPVNDGACLSLLPVDEPVGVRIHDDSYYSYDYGSREPDFWFEIWSRS